ncbi:MAG: hypothetical protein ACM3N5_10135 [Candidatus Eiseniibacteriota bacterium]
MFAATACAATLPSAARAETDACTLLTPAQVSAAVGFPVGAGTHVTPTFVKTCTWTGSNANGTQIVTLNLQTAATYDGAKKGATMASRMGASMKSAGIGDDSFYTVQGSQVTLEVKKGGAAFKVVIYKQMPTDQKEAMELKVAKEVMPKL